jgi:hypothetical protein
VPWRPPSALEASSDEPRALLEAKQHANAHPLVKAIGEDHVQSAHSLSGWLSSDRDIEVQHFFAAPELLVERNGWIVAIIRLDVDDPCTALSRGV